jgi:hypothetical protein
LQAGWALRSPWIGGSIAIVSAIGFGVRLPSLRHEARQLILAQQMVGGHPAEEVTAQGPQ